MIGQAAGELEGGLGGHRRWPARARISSGFPRRQTDRPWTAPAEQARGLEFGIGAENFGSGVKVTLVPRRLGAAPIFCSGPCVMPRENSCANNSLLRATSTRVSVEAR
jgi:hypothetical protein